jgi:phosphatidylserine decarboxylase
VWRAVTRTSFDMDPFVVVSFGKKVFRTRVIRHSLNPVWDEKLLFHVRRYEIGYEVGQRADLVVHAY